MVNQEILDIVSRDYDYHVVRECNGCQLCGFLAVNNFARFKGTNRFEAVKQPRSWEEKEQCFEAMERCPLHGIVRKEARYIPVCEQ